MLSHARLVYLEPLLKAGKPFEKHTLSIFKVGVNIHTYECCNGEISKSDWIENKQPGENYSVLWYYSLHYLLQNFKIGWWNNSDTIILQCGGCHTNEIGAYMKLRVPLSCRCILAPSTRSLWNWVKTCLRYNSTPLITRKRESFKTCHSFNNVLW